MSSSTSSSSSAAGAGANDSAQAPAVSLTAMLKTRQQKLAEAKSDIDVLQRGQKLQQQFVNMVAAQQGAAGGAQTEVASSMIASFSVGVQEELEAQAQKDTKSAAQKRKETMAVQRRDARKEKAKNERQVKAFEEIVKRYVWSGRRMESVEAYLAGLSDLDVSEVVGTPAAPEPQEVLAEMDAADDFGNLTYDEVEPLGKKQKKA